MVDRLQKEIYEKSGMVNKDLISNFILQYFEEDAPYKVKLGVLESLTSILGFSDEEKQ